jgi:peptidyl-prolyl cis-trans isomerase SurA
MLISLIADARRAPRSLVLTACTAACLAAACRTEPPAPSQATVTQDTWAVVDGRQIMREEVDTALHRAQGSTQTMSEEELLTARLGVLDELIVENLLLERARVLKVEVPTSEIDSAFEAAKQNLPAEAFEEELKRRRLTPADIREGLRRELLARKTIEREIGSKVTVTDQDVTDFFNQNRSQFNLTEDAYRVAQIVVTPVRDRQPANRAGDDAATPEQAAAKVKGLMQRLKGGEGFASLARDHSEDPQSAPRGGDLGLVPLSALKQAPPALRDAVLKSQPGSVNVVSVGGIHTIVLVMGREPAGQRDLSMPAVRENITTSLRGRREQLLRTAYLTALRTDANVVNYLARRLYESNGRLSSATPAPGPQ